MIEGIVRHHADSQIHAFLDLDILEQPHIDVEIASATKLIAGLGRERRNDVVKSVEEGPGIQARCRIAIGGLLSGSTGYIGMNVSVRSNARVAEAARGGVTPALRFAFRGGAITGLLVVGLALIGVAGYYGALTSFFNDSPKTAVDALIGLGFGGSLISVFARLGGGIFTKAADVGADLVGKVEAGIPEDDPRNPATIADNVGDNVGDCAGMAADLFETYAVTAVAVILLGVLTFNQSTQVALYPLVIGGVAIIASIIGTFAVRTNTDNVERALLQGLVVSGPIAAAAFAPITYWLMRNLTFLDGSSGAPKWSHLYLCSLIGIAVTALLFGITEYYTSTRFSPVKKTAKASITGHATNIIQGFGSGMQATALPALVIVLGILGAWKLAGGGVTGIYGIGVAVMGLLSLTGLIVALDAFGPITDNAGGIAEMADLPEEVRKVTDRLDAVGNTTKAVTKGYAIGSAVLAAIVLFAGFQKELENKLEHAISFGINDRHLQGRAEQSRLCPYLFPERRERICRGTGAIQVAGLDAVAELVERPLRSGLGARRERSVPRPHDNRGPPVPPIQRVAVVAHVALVLGLVGRQVDARGGGAHLVVGDM